MNEIVIISGKGGTGKTSMAACLADSGPAKVLADCDVDAADLHLVLAPDLAVRHDFVSGELPSVDAEACTGCEICRDSCRFQAIEMADGVARIRTERCEGCGLCHAVCPVDAVAMTPRHCGEWYESHTRAGDMVHAKLGPGEENSGRLVTEVRTRARELAEAQGVGTVLTDGPPGIGCPVIASLTNATLALLVTEPTRTAMHDLERAQELARHFRIRSMVLINKADVNPELARTIRSWCAEHDVPVAGTVPLDNVFVQAQLAGRSAAQHEPERVQPFFQALWKRLLDAEPAPDGDITWKGEPDA